MTQGLLMGSVTVVITLLLLLLVFFDHPHGDGVGRLQPTAMERTLQPDRRPGSRWSGSTVTPPCDEHGNRALTSRPGPWPRLAGGARHRPAGGRRPRHVVEQLPGHPVERRAGQGGQPHERDQDRGRPGPGPGPGPDARSTSPRSSPGPTRTAAARRELADFYVDRFRDEFRPAFDAWIATRPVHEPGRAADALRHARVPGRVRGRRPSSSTPPPRRRRPRCAWTSSGPATTCSPSSSTPWSCSSPAMSTKIANRRLRWVLTVAGCLVLVSALAWIATFPVSLQV